MSGWAAVAALVLAWVGVVIARIREESHRLDVLIWTVEFADDQELSTANSG